MLPLVINVVFLLLGHGFIVGLCDQSEFNKAGDYVLGGLFKLHDSRGERSDKPQAVECDKYDFNPASYKRMRVMQFAIEEVNKRTDLLPGVTLGYRMFDYCSDIGSLPSVVHFMACGDSVRLGANNQSCLPNVVSVTGPFGSTETITVSQVFLSNLLPVVTHGASSVQLSNRQKFPSFFRTIPSDKFQVQAIIHLLKKFRWNWVAFVGNNKDYTLDALEKFQAEIESAESDICLAYQGFISDTDDVANDQVLNVIEQQKIEVVVVFGHVGPVTAFLKKAVERNVQKVWIGSEAWSTSSLELMEESDIYRLGTVLGVTLHQKTEFNRRPVCSTPPQASNGSCGQICEKCGELTAKDVNSQDSTFSFSIYSAIYAVAHALHKILSCNQASCTKSSVEPYMMVKALKNIAFTLYNQSIEFDENGDPPATYDIVFWNWTSKTIDTVGSYNSMPEPSFSLDQDLIHWHSGKDPPILRCSADCNQGQQKNQTSFHNCCFDCVTCTAGTYINHTIDNSSCTQCPMHEWSSNGSTSCQERTEVYPHFDDPLAILLIVSTGVTILLCCGALALFIRYFDSPVVKSAGGKMSLLVLGFLALSCVSVFLLLGQPSHVKCKLRMPIFLVFYTATLACLAVRSFQIVCVFKMAAKLPKAYDFWVKHGGQWVIVAICFVVQVVLSVVWMSIDGPVPIENYVEEEIVFTCTDGPYGLLFAMFTVIALLSLVCFALSYMGTDLPKNYNEGKAIAFCLFIFYVSWTLFLTLYFILSQYGNSSLIMMAMGSSMLSSIFGVLLGYFGPKCFIIIFRPERNTTTYFQAAIQTYNLQIR